MSKLDITSYDISCNDYVTWIFREDWYSWPVEGKIIKEIAFLDTSTHIGGKRVMTINSFRYQSAITKIVFLLSKVENPFVYNNLLDMLINKHDLNVQYDNNYVELLKVKSKGKKKTKKKKENTFVPIAASLDMFNGDIKFLHKDISSGKEVYSDDKKIKKEDELKPFKLVF